MCFGRFAHKIFYFAGAVKINVFEFFIPVPAAVFGNINCLNSVLFGEFQWFDNTGDGRDNGDIMFR